MQAFDANAEKMITQLWDAWRTASNGKDRADFIDRVRTRLDAFVAGQSAKSAAE